MLVRRTMYPGNLCRLIGREHIQGQTLVISPLDAAGRFESSCTRLPHMLSLSLSYTFKGLTNECPCFFSFIFSSRFSHLNWLCCLYN